MRFETTAANLDCALRLMAGVVARRGTVPVLGSVKFDGGRLVGTNLDMELEVALPTIGAMAGAAAVDFAVMAALARRIAREETVELTERDGVAALAFNGARYTLPSYPANDFPRFAVADFSSAARRMETHNAGLAEAMRAVGFAMSTDWTRYYLQGVALVRAPEGDGMAVAATDGHRLAIKPLPFALDGGEGRIVDAATVKFLTALKREPNAVTFHAHIAAAQFDYDGLRLRAKLIDATYPDIYAVIPRDAARLFRVDRLAMLGALRRVAAFASGLARAVRIAGDGAGALSLQMINPSIGECSETIACEASEPFECGFNPHYLVDALRALKKSETVSFAARLDGGAATGATVIAGDNDDLTVVVMPMRV